MKFLKAEPIEFYVSTSGYLVFKNYTITIVLTPDQSKLLQKQLPELIKEHEEVWTGVDQE
jgi:hypothetical protein